MEYTVPERVSVRCAFSVPFPPRMDRSPDVVTNDVTNAIVLCCRMSRSWRLSVEPFQNIKKSTRECESRYRRGLPTPAINTAVEDAFQAAYVMIVRTPRTNNVEGDEARDLGQRADLALVDAGVFFLWVLDLQHPRVRVLHVDGLETLVRRVREAPHRQHVEVPAPDPGHLDREGHGQLEDNCDVHIATLLA